MPTNFPTSLDTVTELPDVAANTPLAQSGNLKHSQQHINAADALRAIQVKVGIASSTDTNSLEYRIRVDPHTMRGATVDADSDEFDGSSLPGTYAWTNQGTATATVANGVLRFAWPQGGAATAIQLTKALVAGTAYRYEAMYSYPMQWGGTTIVGFGVRNDTTGLWAGIGFLSDASTSNWRMSLSYGTNGTYRGETGYIMSNPPSRIWFAIERSGTNIFFEYSLNGVTWIRQYTITTSGTEIGSAPDRIGVIKRSTGTSAGYNTVAHISYIRRVS